MLVDDYGPAGMRCQRGRDHPVSVMFPMVATVSEVIAETAVSRLTERGATRADDRISEAGMEDRKREGYF